MQTQWIPIQEESHNRKAVDQLLNILQDCLYKLFGP